MLEWWSTTDRNVPWRGARDPWLILVAEVMSQQTQLPRVSERLAEFIARFPTPRHLADADRTAVLAAWIGLGYNRRALRLQQAAHHIASSGWPTDAAGLRELPGVGPYTAAAVASQAWAEPVPAIDTNLRRVLTRWIGGSPSSSQLQERADLLIPQDEASAWNQAIMDLAATICRPRPECAKCPVEPWCADPSASVPTTRQGSFEGSVRQARGHIIRRLVAGQADTPDLIEGLASDVAATALHALEEEGVISQVSGTWRVTTL